jgi:GDP-D-mannose dehydratase
VVGSRGQDGRLLTKQHKLRGDSVYGVRAFASSLEKNSEIFDFQVDFANQDVALPFLTRLKPELIYHVAAVHTSTPKYIDFEGGKKDEMIKCHIGITQNIVKYQTEINQNCKSVVALSSKMYSPKEITTYVNESSIPSPTDFYGETKLRALDMIKEARERHNINTIGAILFNHSSSLSKSSFLFPSIAQAIALDKSLFETIHNWNCRIDMSCAVEVCDALIVAGTSDLSKEIVLGSGRLSYLPDVVIRCLGILGKKIDRRIKDVEKRDVPTLCSDIQQANQILHWNPRCTPESLLSNMILSLESQVSLS